MSGLSERSFSHLLDCFRRARHTDLRQADASAMVGAFDAPLPIKEAIWVMIDFL
jgi:hypothetical protein